MSVALTIFPLGITDAILKSDTKWDNSLARAEAKDAGIEWQLPEGDKRSLQEIIDDSPLLKNLGDQNGLKEQLKDRIGNFETDRDAAFRATQVLDHIEQLDGSGNRLASNDVDNGKVDGFTSQDHARNGTEAGRLQDFIKYGFENLEGELKQNVAVSDDPATREKAEALGITWDRPEHDDRSAKDIIDDNPLLKELGNQSGVKDMLKEQVGDFETDADAAHRAVQVLEHIEQFDGAGTRIAGKDVANDRIDGFTKDREAKNGTEAGRLQDFGKDGFSALKGVLSDISAVGDDKQAREAAESVGIVWERPGDDDRSAKDILEDNPLLQNLGNQSGVKDMLKERVGNFETDADAAFRAAQVLDRVTMYDSEGKTLSGNDLLNDSIDGFTKSGEAHNGTEAGRLQDFGKHGFSALDELPKSSEITSFKDFLKTNPDADEGSKTIAKYTAILQENFDAIRGKKDSGDYLTAESLKEYLETNTHLTDEVKDAIQFWSQPGAFEKLDNAKHSLAQKPDGDVSANDLSSWLKDSAPKDALTSMDFLTSVATGNVLADVDTSTLDNKIFENPQDYSAEQKAAVLKELVTAQRLIIEGGEAGMWKDDQSILRITNATQTHPDPKLLLEDVNRHIQILQSDPQVSAYMDEQGSKALKDLVNDNEGLKTSLEKTYKDEIKTGDALDTLWTTRTAEKVGQTSILAEFVGTTQSYATALGIDSPTDLQHAVSQSAHNDEFKDFYKDSLVTGDRMTELLKDHSFAEASSVFSLEVAVYNSALDPVFTEKLDQELNENYSAIAKDNALEGLSFEALDEIFGAAESEEFDQKKVEDLVETLAEENPQFLLNQDGTITDEQRIVAGVRGLWDMFRQGTKVVDKAEFLNPNGKIWDTVFKGTADRGAQHAISGLLLGGLTAYNAQKAGGALTERQLVDVVTGSVMSTSLLMEGGAKGYKTYLENTLPKGAIQPLPDNATARDLLIRKFQVDNKAYKDMMVNVADKFENAGKGVGGTAGMVLGAYQIFDSVKALRAGDKLTGGMGIAAGSLSSMAGLAGAAEAMIGLVAGSRAIPAVLAMISGGLGWLAAGVGALATIIPGLVAEVKQEKRVEKFADVLEDYVTKYGIDGNKDGTYRDIPEEAWPSYDDSALSGS